MAANPLGKTLVRFEAKAEKLRGEPGAELPEPNQVLTRNAAALNIFTEGMQAESEADRKACLTTPRLSPVTWPQLLEAAGERLKKEIVLERTRVRPAEPEVTVTITPTVEKASTMRKELGEIIGGNGAARDEKAALRQLVFGGRTPQGSKSAYESEFDLMLEAITVNAEEMPDGVLAFVPKLQAMRRELDEARPAPPPKKKAEAPLSEQLQAATWFAHAVHDELYSWLLSVAPERIKSTARRTFVARKPPEREEAKSEPPQASAPATPAAEAPPAQPAAKEG